MMPYIRLVPQAHHAMLDSRRWDVIKLLFDCVAVVNAATGLTRTPMTSAARTDGDYGEAEMYRVSVITGRRIFER